MTTSPGKIVLLVPRPDGFLISIDGVSYWKDMSPVQQLWMAERFLQAGLEGIREEEAKQQGGPGDKQRHEEDNL